MELQILLTLTACVLSGGEHSVYTFAVCTCGVEEHLGANLWQIALSKAVESSLLGNSPFQSNLNNTQDIWKRVLQHQMGFQAHQDNASSQMKCQVELCLVRRFATGNTTELPIPVQ